MFEKGYVCSSKVACREIKTWLVKQSKQWKLGI
jgi:hypothetical protein